MNNRVKDGDIWVYGEATQAPVHRLGDYRRARGRVPEQGQPRPSRGEVSTNTWDDKDTGAKRTADHVTVTAIGASLRYCTVKTVKVERTTAPDYDDPTAG